MVSLVKDVGSMPHVIFGVLGIVAAIWIAVEALNISETNVKRIRLVSILLTILMWLSYIIGGYWYVKYYALDKAVINAGPWPWAHSFAMEAKEHIFFLLLMLSTYVPFVTYSEKLLTDKKVRNLVIVSALIIAGLGLSMEGFGALINMGYRLGLQGGVK